VVSRSEGPTKGPFPSSLEGGGGEWSNLRLRRDEIDFNELSIHIKISYKTILIVFTLFNVGDRIINALFN